MAKGQKTKEKKEKYSISNATVIEPKKKLNLENEGSKFIVILLCIVAFIGTLWLVSSLKDKKEEKETKPTEVKIDYSTVIVGNMLDQKYDKYLVYAYNGEVENSDNIEQLLYYKEHVYRLDLDKAYNSSVVSDKSNFKGELSDIRFKGETLLVVEKGKIKEFYEGSENIIKYLSK